TNRRSGTFLPEAIRLPIQFVARFCRSVLRRHWPKAKLVEDIRKVIPAGFPCQDVSLARGNHGRSGLKGNHTSLFFELMRLVEAKTRDWPSHRPRGMGRTRQRAAVTGAARNPLHLYQSTLQEE